MELKSSPRNWSAESFACPSKEIALVVTWTRDWNAVNAGSIQIETKGTSPSSYSGTQIRYRVGRVAESRKVSVSARIVHCSSETHLSSSRRQRSRKAENEFMSWGSLQKRESFPLARALCVPESEQEFRSASCYARQPRSSRSLPLPGGSGSLDVFSIYTSVVAPTLPLLGRHITWIP